MWGKHNSQSFIGIIVFLSDCHDSQVFIWGWISIVTLLIFPGIAVQIYYMILDLWAQN